MSSLQLSAIISAVENGDPHARVVLLQLLSPGLEILTNKRIDRRFVKMVVNGVMGEVFKEIEKGNLRDAQSLPPFVRRLVVTICGRFLQSTGQRALLPQNQGRPGERTRIAVDFIERLRIAEVVALRAFYIDGDSAIDVCSFCGLSPSEFRELKAHTRETLEEGSVLTHMPARDYNGSLNQTRSV